mmetsp:Transcript_14739/g.59913  ORF Transcript_14739/g.59913 Transcript_14739/m.59913 type:complete len:89 (-) Transcript_14739:272-538(-)
MSSLTFPDTRDLTYERLEPVNSVLVPGETAILSAYCRSFARPRTEAEICGSEIRTAQGTMTADVQASLEHQNIFPPVQIDRNPRLQST